MESFECNVFVLGVVIAKDGVWLVEELLPVLLDGVVEVLGGCCEALMSVALNYQLAHCLSDLMKDIPKVSTPPFCRILCTLNDNGRLSGVSDSSPGHGKLPIRSKSSSKS